VSREGLQRGNGEAVKKERAMIEGKLREGKEQERKRK